MAEKFYCNLSDGLSMCTKFRATDRHLQRVMPQVSCITHILEVFFFWPCKEWGTLCFHLWVFKFGRRHGIQNTKNTKKHNFGPCVQWLLNGNWFFWTKSSIPFFFFSLCMKRVSIVFSGSHYPENFQDFIYLLISMWKIKIKNTLVYQIGRQ